VPRELFVRLAEWIAQQAKGGAKRMSAISTSFFADEDRPTQIGGRPLKPTSDLAQANNATRYDGCVAWWAIVGQMSEGQRDRLSG
jgi:hypothetical protein